MTIEYIESIIEGCKNNSQVRERLKKAGIEYDDRSWPAENGGEEILSLYVDETYRIFKRHKESHYTVWKYQKCKFKASGIPTFMPGGRDTLAEIL